MYQSVMDIFLCGCFFKIKSAICSTLDGGNKDATGSKGFIFIHVIMLAIYIFEN